MTNSAQPTNTMAVISLASGILSWFFFPIIGAVVAIITGHMARKEIQNSGGAQTGDGLALVGLILGYVHLATFCVTFLIFLLLFGGMIGLSGCAILAEGASLLVPDNVVSLLP